MKKHRYLMVAAVAGLAALGCQSKFPPTHKWELKIVLKGTGKPLPGGTIELENVQDPSLKGFGDIDAKGIANIVTFKGRDEIRGLVAGEHRVRIEVRRDVGATISSKYKDFATSGLKIQIPAATNPLVLEVEGTTS